MVRFCPHCANVLLVEKSASLRFFCQTCPYVHAITSKQSTKLQLQRKEVDDVLGGDESWKNAQTTKVDCPECNHKHAFFVQLQIRSADEPMTTFFRCVACKAGWRED